MRYCTIININFMHAGNGIFSVQPVFVKKYKVNGFFGQVSTNEGRKETALCRFQDPLPKDNHTYGLNCFSDND